MAVAPSAMLHVASMQPGHADTLYHTALMQTAWSAIDNTWNRNAEEQK